LQAANSKQQAEKKSRGLGKTKVDPLGRSDDVVSDFGSNAMSRAVNRAS